MLCMIGQMIGVSALPTFLIGARDLFNAQCMHQPIEIQMIHFLNNRKQVLTATLRMT